MSFEIEPGSTLDEAIGQAIGYASMCWVGGTGDLEFDSTAASQCAEALTAYVKQERDKTMAKEQISWKQPPRRWVQLNIVGTQAPDAEPPVPDV